MISPHFRRQRGFTLVEVLTSMTIGSMVLLAAVGVLRSTGDGYERIGGGVAAEREARALLGQITEDLSTARYHEDMRIEKGSETWPLSRIGFLSLQPDDAQLEENRIGDLCAVRYYIKDESIGGKTVRCLMRGFTESAETFSKVKNKQEETLFTSSSSGSGEADEAIAFGVVSFDAVPKKRDAAGVLTEWKSGTGEPPDVISLRLVIARKELSAKLSDPAAWSGKGHLASLLGAPADAERNKNLQVYETTVRFGRHE